MTGPARFAGLRTLAGARVCVVGAGRQGASAARLLLQLGARVVVGDDAPGERVVAALRRYGVEPSALELHSDGPSPEWIDGAEWVVLSAGVPRSAPAPARAFAAGIPIVNEVELGAAQLDDPTIAAITGTNGKSTTTTLLGGIAHAVDAHAFVGGNLGVPLCEALASGARPTTLVLELSSYQLETIEWLPLRVAVITNLAPDHLDRYPSVAAYYAAKARMLHLLCEGGEAVLNEQDAQSRERFAAYAGPRFPFLAGEGREGVCLERDDAVVRRGAWSRRVSLAHPHIVGAHNRANAAAALAAAAVLGWSPDAWEAGIAAYRGIAHRLERLGDARGVTFYNDSKATNVDAAITALRSFSGGVHLIAGGVGKGAPYEPLVDACTEGARVRRVYTIGSDGPVIATACEGRVPVWQAGELELAVHAAFANAVPGDVILLAPACASFDQFTDYQARGTAFRACFEQYARRS